MNKLITAGKGFNMQLMWEILWNSWISRLDEIGHFLQIHLHVELVWILDFEQILNIFFIVKWKDVMKLLFITFALIIFPFSHFSIRQPPMTLRLVFVSFTFRICATSPHILLSHLVQARLWPKRDWQNQAAFMGKCVPGWHWNHLCKSSSAVYSQILY